MYTRHRNGHSTFLRSAKWSEMGLFGSFFNDADIVQQLEFKSLESTVRVMSIEREAIAKTSALRRLFWEAVLAT